MIRFKVPAVPVAQPRARATAIGGRARMYEAKSDHPIHAFKASVRVAAKSAYSGAPLQGPLSVELYFILPRPKSATKKRGDNPRYWHTGRGDCDNFAKGFLDALNGLTISDDAAVCRLYVSKKVAAASEQPHVEAVIEQLEATP